jgi:hypothetical protein
MNNLGNLLADTDPRPHKAGLRRQQRDCPCNVGQTRCRSGRWPSPRPPTARPARPGGQRDQDDLGAFAADAQYPVAVFFAKVGDVGAGGFDDPQVE